MRGRPSVWRRTERLVAIHGNAATRRYVDELAAREGLDPEDVWREAQALQRAYDHLELHTEAGRVAYVVADLGIPVAQIEAELDQLRASRS